MTTIPSPEDLAAAKQAAEEAEARQHALEREVQAGRRKVKALWQHYDDLVLIVEGQNTLDF